ncbi:hypothetical protein TWF696_008987 [Orbilia brochopaga]|uniref:Uncharacterized protein n=1 Tax=Orbilia brochopaga TaxID=3140254 RepID=A0AAV9UG83_9PEZI
MTTLFHHTAFSMILSILLSIHSLALAGQIVSQTYTNDSLTYANEPFLEVFTAPWDETTHEYHSMSETIALPPTEGTTQAQNVSQPLNITASTTTTIASPPRRHPCNIIAKAYDSWSRLLFSTVAKTLKAIKAIKEAHTNMIHILTHPPFLPENATAAIEHTISQRLLDTIYQNITAVLKDVIRTDVPGRLADLETLVESYIDMFQRSNGAVVPLPSMRTTRAMLGGPIQWDVISIFAAGTIFGIALMGVICCMCICLCGCGGRPRRPHSRASSRRKSPTASTNPSSQAGSEAVSPVFGDSLQRAVHCAKYQPIDPEERVYRGSDSSEDVVEGTGAASLVTSATEGLSGLPSPVSQYLAEGIQPQTGDDYGQTEHDMCSVSPAAFESTQHSHQNNGALEETSSGREPATPAPPPRKAEDSNEETEISDSSLELHRQEFRGLGVEETESQLDSAEAAASISPASGRENAEPSTPNATEIKPEELATPENRRSRKRKSQKRKPKNQQQSVAQLSTEVIPK